MITTLEFGDKLLCTKSEVDHWTSGKMYELKLNKLGALEIRDEDGDEAYSSYLLECLNKEWDLVEFELIKKEVPTTQEFKVGDLVEVVENKSFAYKNNFNLFEKGDKAIVTEVYGNNVRIGNNKYGNLLNKKEIKKVESTPELTEYEEELILHLSECIQFRNNRLSNIQQFKNSIKINEEEIEKTSKEIKEITKKLLTK
ncbi:hypothetical protein H3T68_gp01 [Enterococcus phage vB_EfaP_Efmus4]|uniref:Uncharacterized protein n=1 Tax=Enterococcus phage vB_EfaP_Efmus4 TaxID=2546626 RepID=A0A4D6DUA9_9CAUD|nr:hypothetical protein H3T68_gp01 [Enterococcus phage vB_EfaP_Efmus4]QBZ69369.1 hypothetical protein [Enterococcus phage vB_EfaP_Efmus4]